jgi:hypothetical protein
MGAQVSGSSQVATHLRGYLGYRAWWVLSAGAAALNEWHKIPRQRFSARLFWTPVKSFSISLLATRISATTWADYWPIDGAAYPVLGEGTYTYKAKVPSWTNIDVQIRKQFWQRRLAASVLLKNLLNDEVRYHPIGGTNHLTLYVIMELGLE